MARFHADRVAFDSATTGTGNLSPGAALNDSFVAHSETAIQNNDTVYLLIQEGLDFEICDATYVAAGPHFTRDTVIVSKIGGTVGSAKMDLQGGAEVRFVAPSVLWGEIAAFQPFDSDLTSWANVARASGFDTFAASPSSANLRALLTDESGTGLAYFQGGALGTPSSGTLTNCTGLTTGGVAPSTLITEGEGIASNDNDTTLPTSAAVKDYVDNNAGSSYSVVVRVLTSGTSETPPAGMVSAKVWAIGGGGGGGGARVTGTSGVNAGGGGESGGSCFRAYNATEFGSGAAIAIGAAGSAGANTGGNGGDGGNTSFNPDGTGTTITAAGGDGGDGLSNDEPNVFVIGGRNKGSATGGQINIAGQAGGDGHGGEQLDGRTALGGSGGSTRFGNGGQGQRQNEVGTGLQDAQSKAGLAGTGFGAGGAGATSIDASNAGAAGGAGAPGALIIEYLVESS